MMTRVLFLQEKVPHYRVPFFRGLAKAGFDVTVAHSSNANEDPGYREVTLPSLSVAGTLLQSGALRLSREYDVVVVGINPRWVAGLGVLWSRRESGRTSIVWGHGFGKNRAMNRVRVTMCRRADAVAVYDEAAVSPLADAGVPAESIHVVPNTLEVPGASFDPDGSRKQFLFVGRLQDRKALDVLIRVFSRLVPAWPDGQLLIVGDGKVRSKLLAQVEHLGIGGRVRFVDGTTDPEMLRSEFQKSLAYVSPKAAGLGILHSFAFGVPVVALSDHSHGPEIANCIHGQNSLLCEGEDGLLEAMRSLVNERHLSATLGRAAFDHYVSLRRMDQMVGAMARLLHGIADPSGVTSRVQVAA